MRVKKGQRLFQVGQQIIQVFEADMEAQQVLRGCAAARGLLADQALVAAPAGALGEQLQAGQEGIHAVLRLGGEHDTEEAGGTAKSRFQNSWPGCPGSAG